MSPRVIERAYTDCPKQVIFVSDYEYDFVEENFDELIKNEGLNPNNFDINDPVDIIRQPFLQETALAALCIKIKLFVDAAAEPLN